MTATPGAAVTTGPSPLLRPLRWWAVALPGSLGGATLISWGCFGAGVTAQRLWFFAFALVGLAGFAAALRAIDRGAAREPAPASWRGLLLLALACQAAVLLARPLTSNDALANLSYGRILERGGDPFLTTPRQFFDHPLNPGRDGGFAKLIDAQWRDTPCAYGPVVALLDAAAVRIGGSPGGALITFKLLTALAALGGLVIAFALARQSGRPAAFALLGLNPLYAWELTGQAHNDAFVVPLVALFVWAVRRPHVAAAAAAAGLSFLVKPVLLPVYALWVAALAVGPKRAPRALALAVALPALLLLAGWLPFWTGPATLAMAGKSLVGGHVEAANSLGEALCHLAAAVAPAWAPLTLGLVRVLGLAVAAAAGLLAVRKVARGADVIDQGLPVMLLLMGVVAWFQPWYVTWALPLAVATQTRALAWLTGAYAATFMLGYVSNQYGSSWFIHLGMLVALLRWHRWRVGRTSDDGRADAPAA